MTEYDRTLERLGEQLSELSPEDSAALFGVAAEALLPLYRAFSEREGFGDPDLLRSGLDDMWLRRSGRGGRHDVGDLLERLADVAPHADDFDSVDVTYAQDAVVSTDAALRYLDGDPDVDPGWIEYALEPVRWFLQNRLLAEEGTDLRTEDEVLEEVSRDPLHRAAVAYLESAIAFLRRNPGATLDEILASVGTPDSLQPSAV